MHCRSEDLSKRYEGLLGSKKIFNMNLARSQQDEHRIADNTLLQPRLPLFLLVDDD
jgi:hypothetical protein